MFGVVVLGKVWPVFGSGVWDFEKMAQPSLA